MSDLSIKKLVSKIYLSISPSLKLVFSKRSSPSFFTSKNNFFVFSWNSSNFKESIFSIVFLSSVLSLAKVFLFTIKLFPSGILLIFPPVISTKTFLYSKFPGFSSNELKAIFFSEFGKATSFIEFFLNASSLISSMP